MDEDIVAPSIPPFNKRFVSDTYISSKNDETDELCNGMNSYHQNIKLTLELDSAKFLDTEITQDSGKITTQV